MPYIYGSHTHYLMSQETHKALYGPVSSGVVVAIINAMPSEQAAKYYNSSRHHLGKIGLYLRTKAGDAALVADVAAAKFDFKITVSDTCPSCTLGGGVKLRDGYCPVCRVNWLELPNFSDAELTTRPKP